MALLERAIFDLWGDVTSTENRVPPPVTSCHLFGEAPSLPPWGDVIYGWSLTDFCSTIELMYCTWFFSYPKSLLSLLSLKQEV